MFPPGPLLIPKLSRPPDLTWHVPGSKSITNRALVLAALADGESTLTGALHSDDTRHMRDALASLGTSVWIALLTVAFSLAVAVPAGYALARLKLPWRSGILLLFLLPQAVPNLPVYVNIAQVFYQIGLNGTVLGVVLVHASHGLVLAVWIASAAFASIDVSLEEASRNLGASPWTCFRTVTLPLATPGLIASAIFVFLESLDEFTGTYFVGVPDVTTLPLLMFNATMGGNYQISSITALLLLIPSIGFMLVVERFLKADVLAMVGR